MTCTRPEASQISDKFEEVQQLIHVRDTMYHSLQAQADVAHTGTSDPNLIEATMEQTGVVFYINQSKYILSFELDAKYIHSETLVVYDSIRPTKLYNRSYDAATDSTSIEFGSNLKMSRKSQDVISGNTINNCSVLAAFGKSNVERTRLNDVYDYFANSKDVLAPGMLLSGMSNHDWIKTRQEI